MKPPSQLSALQEMYAQASFDEPADTDMEIEPPNQDNDWTWPEELALHEGAERPG